MNAGQEINAEHVDFYFQSRCLAHADQAALTYQQPIAKLGGLLIGGTASGVLAFWGQIIDTDRWASAKSLSAVFRGESQCLKLGGIEHHQPTKQQGTRAVFSFSFTSLEIIANHLEDPGYVVRCMILDACKDRLRAGEEDPNHIDVTPGMEHLLRHHMLSQNQDDMGTFDTPIQPATILGMTAHWDAADFSVWYE
jgi:hypothetical protein